MSHDELQRAAAAARSAWGEFMHFLRAVHVYQSAKAAAACRQRVDDARHELDLAQTAHDKALQDYRVHSLPIRNSEVPLIDNLRKEQTS